MKRSIMIAAVAAVALTAGNAVANDQKNAIAIGSGLFSYAATYERLLGGLHGLVAEGQLATSDDGSVMGGGVGYRLHFSKEKGLGSGFIGVMVKYLMMDGDVTVTSGTSVSKTPFDATLFSVVPNIGKRWIIGPGVAITARAGYGYSSADFNWSSVDAVDGLIETAFEFLGAFDGELSIGYAF